MRWWGWGVDGHDGPLPKAAAALLRDELGAGGATLRPVELDRVELPGSQLPAGARERLAAIVGATCVLDDRVARITHAAGRSYPDLVRLRTGRGLNPPDAVVYPGTREQVAALLAACAKDGIAVVPFGGGTSVVGGVEALRGSFDAVISVDLARLSALIAVDERSQLATFAAGTLGPELERLLATRGLTLGHFPQSFQFSTVGGWAATRSAGQASTGYGRIDELVVSLRAATPAGEIETRTVPATAAGPDLRELLVGSEGALGIITDVTLRVRPQPRARRYEGWSLPSFAAGTEALRELEQSGAAPDVSRLSDEEETRLTLALASGSTGARLLHSYLRARGRGSACMAILGFEGADSGRVNARRARAKTILRRHGALQLGPAPGAAWLKGRYHGPYVRDELLTRGVFVETLETAATWTALQDTHRAVGDALRHAFAARGTPARVMCHVSHLYPTGASLYFTFLARQEHGSELEQWQAAKAAACDAILASGATITHHHAIGRDHVPWLSQEIGDLGVEALRAVKQRLDPAGIMNPGKLVP
ncbi:MAG: alkyldihydroxyacetonephosphate synthase [Solirubrobacteraceae bacterium]|jgi:alkyldihydroxyacetonephosphate synthase|nr:alkyldihydroxyacetonephosphate synthase [Solirubrobacteraceae bacterium]